MPWDATPIARRDQLLSPALKGTCGVDDRSHGEPWRPAENASDHPNNAGSRTRHEPVLSGASVVDECQSELLTRVDTRRDTRPRLGRSGPDADEGSGRHERERRYCSGGRGLGWRRIDGSGECGRAGRTSLPRGVLLCIRSGNWDERSAVRSCSLRRTPRRPDCRIWVRGSRICRQEQRRCSPMSATPADRPPSRAPVRHRQHSARRP